MCGRRHEPSLIQTVARTPQIQSRETESPAATGLPQHEGLSFMPVMSLQPALFEGEQVPQIFPDDSARAGTFHPVTSHLAADSITAEGLRDSRMHVLLDLQAHGRCGAWELEARAGRWSGSRLRTALTELEGLGQVQRFEGTGLTARGRKCNEFALTILGLEALEAAR